MRRRGRRGSLPLSMVYRVWISRLEGRVCFTVLCLFFGVFGGFDCIRAFLHRVGR